MHLRKNSIFKDKIMIFLIILIIVTLLAFFRGSFVYWDEYCGFSVFNSNAKLVYTNTATLLTKAEMKHNKILPDGIYSGSLCRGGDVEPDYSEPAKYLDDMLNYLMGGPKGGYYCTVIAGGVPVASYWSRTSVAADHSEQLGIIGYNDIDEKGKIKGRMFGAYPSENYGRENISLDRSGSTLPLYENYVPGKTGQILKKYRGYSEDSGLKTFDIIYFVYFLTRFPYCMLLPAEILFVVLRVKALKKKARCAEESLSEYN